MSNVKKFSLSIVMLLVLIMTLGVVYAANVYVPVFMTVKDANGHVFENNEIAELKAGDKIYVSAYCNNAESKAWAQNSNFMEEWGFKVNGKGMAILSYMIDSTDSKDYIRSSDPTQLTITIPNFEVGSRHYIVIDGVGAIDGLPTEDGNEYQATTGTFALKFVMVEGSGSDKPDDPVEPSNPDDDELIVESWEKEDNNMEELAVSLRNDSDEYEKANKNFYALGEEVVYYVSYKNGGKDITREVKLVLELPLDFEVVDAFGGKVDYKERTITWTFPDGLEEDQAGTKVVKLAYTGFSRSSKKYEIVYPVADIYERNKVVDSSAVVNYIFKNEKTEITDEHYPYMYGDNEKPTFRPDDTITRAEGALVLTRIFGINTSGTTVVGNEYSDIAETYPEAQRAIVAATKLGLINGYIDGTYKPNKTMTKAEFMKIIACYVEAKAEDDDVRGLEVKDDTNITIYKNPTSLYVTGNTTTDRHWAINYVTLLARINMTPVSSSNRNLGLDEQITRAEVAQLVNFYLLRAPQETSSSTRIQFSDVSKRHELFGDIVEATMKSHTYTLTSEGYEVAED